MSPLVTFDAKAVKGVSGCGTQPTTPSPPTNCFVSYHFKGTFLDACKTSVGCTTAAGRSRMVYLPKLLLLSYVRATTRTETCGGNCTASLTIGLIQRSRVAGAIKASGLYSRDFLWVQVSSACRAIAGA